MEQENGQDRDSAHAFDFRPVTLFHWTILKVIPSSGTIERGRSGDNNKYD
jgi:hypothetical protein